MTARNFKRLRLFGGCFVTIVLAIILLPTNEYARFASPDKRFYAVARYSRWWSFVPAMPGGSGDKPGTITIYSSDGHSCGRVPIEMVNMIQELRWTANVASIPAVAEWDLYHRRVHIF